MAKLHFSPRRNRSEAGKSVTASFGEMRVADVAAESSPSEVGQSRCTSLGPQRRSGLSGQLACTAEQSIQDQRTLHMTMQLMLRGESDTAEHLLAVPRSGQRRLPGRGLGEQNSQIVGLGSGGNQCRLRSFNGDQRLGQPMTDRLERGDRLTELHTV
jgi:hypothetical protein